MELVVSTFYIHASQSLDCVKIFLVYILQTSRYLRFYTDSQVVCARSPQVVSAKYLFTLDQHFAAPVEYKQGRKFQNNEQTLELLQLHFFLVRQDRAVKTLNWHTVLGSCSDQQVDKLSVVQFWKKLGAHF